MAVCIICGGSGFTLQDGLCRECNGTGQCDFNCDAILFEDVSEDVYPYGTPELKLYRYHAGNLSLWKDIEQKASVSER